MRAVVSMCILHSYILSLFFIRQIQIQRTHMNTYYVLRSHAENEIFNTLNTFDSSAVSILDVAMILVLCSFTF